MYITQLIYLHPGQEAVFEAFEAVAIPLIAAQGGELLFRIRPDAASMVDGTIELPYEIHLVSFPSQIAFDQFAKDPRRQAFLHLKEASIRSAFLVKGEKI